MHRFFPSRVWSSAVLAGVLAVVGASASPADAAPVTIQNPSFETDVDSTDPPGVGSVAANDGSAAYTMAPPGWTLNYANNAALGVYNPPEGAGSYTNAGDGSPTGGTPTGGDGKLIYFNTGFGSGNLAGIYQDLTEALQPNTTYTLTAAVGARIGRPAMRYYIDLATTDQNPAAGQHIARFTTDGSDLVPGTFVDRSVTFVTGEAGTDPNVGKLLRVQLFAENTANEVQSTDFDNIRLEAIPEPTGLGLLLLGGAGALARRRGRRA